MKPPLRLLHLEDDPTDADLVLSMLVEGGIVCEVHRVDARDDFLAALQQAGFDMILADYSLPSFDGLAALTLAREHCPDVPFVFVSATLGEELAIDAMLRGATDYILKQRLGRLVPSVQRVLRELAERTERKKAEEALRQSERQFRQAQKMEAVGRLAGGLAHDFNNLLTVIMGYSQVLLNELGAQHSLRSKIAETQKAGERAAVLIRQLLAFSRKQPLEPRIVSLNAVVMNVEAMLRRLVGENIQLIIERDPDDGYVKADPGQLEQVLMNLVVNARDAMPHGGSLTIRISTVVLSRPPLSALQPLAAGPYMKVSVSDTGCGMDADTQSHVFEPFFTTKEEGKGTGLGLSTVYGIVTQSGGRVDLTSAVGEGTTFDIYLPQIERQPETISAQDAPLSVSRGSETVLLVEDEPAVREVVRDQLRQVGYQVIEAKNGVEACLFATQQAGSFHVLITDIVMPGMSGREVANHLRALRPGLKVIFMSGYTDDLGIDQGLDAATTAFLQKPLSPEALITTLRDALDGRLVSPTTPDGHLPPQQTVGATSSSPRGSNGQLRSGQMDLFEERRLGRRSRT
ncbi:MAG: response regulator [Nitrospiraceae bacterium]